MFYPTVSDSIEIPKSHRIFNNPVHKLPPTMKPSVILLLEVLPLTFGLLSALFL